MKFIRYIKTRLNERSTWVAIGAGIAGASVLPHPFSWLAIAAAVIGSIVPDGGVTNDKPSNN